MSAPASSSSDPWARDRLYNTSTDALSGMFGFLGLQETATLQRVSKDLAGRSNQHRLKHGISGDEIVDANKIFEFSKIPDTRNMTPIPYIKRVKIWYEFQFRWFPNAVEMVIGDNDFGSYGDYSIRRYFDRIGNNRDRFLACFPASLRKLTYEPRSAGDVFWVLPQLTELHLPNYDWGGSTIDFLPGGNLKKLSINLLVIDPDIGNFNLLPKGLVEFNVDSIGLNRSFEGVIYLTIPKELKTFKAQQINNNIRFACNSPNPSLKTLKVPFMYFNNRQKLLQEDKPLVDAHIIHQIEKVCIQDGDNFPYVTNLLSELNLLIPNLKWFSFACAIFDFDHFTIQANHIPDTLEHLSISVLFIPGAVQSSEYGTNLIIDEDAIWRQKPNLKSICVLDTAHTNNNTVSGDQLKRITDLGWSTDDLIYKKLNIKNCDMTKSIFLTRPKGISTPVVQENIQPLDAPVDTVLPMYGPFDHRQWSRARGIMPRQFQLSNQPDWDALEQLSNPRVRARDSDESSDQPRSNKQKTGMRLLIL